MNAQRRLPLLFALLAAIAFLSPHVASAANDDAVVVIINKDNPHLVDQSYVAAIYTGRLKGWPDGSPVFPLDQSDGVSAREIFYSRFVGRSSAYMQAVWAQNIFAGKGLPPKIASPDSEMKRIVSTNRNAIGYLRASEVDDTVRVLLR
jgi:ABC-type phosphate transport system substrate-binding protein